MKKTCSYFWKYAQCCIAESYVLVAIFFLLFLVGFIRRTKSLEITGIFWPLETLKLSTSNLFKIWNFKTVNWRQERVWGTHHHPSDRKAHLNSHVSPVLHINPCFLGLMRKSRYALSLEQRRHDNILHD